MGNFLNDFYGKENSTDRIAPYVALVFFIVGSISTLVLTLNKDNHDLFSFTASIYIICMIFSFSLFIISMYFFSKHIENRYIRWMQYSLLIGSIILLAIAFLPLTIFQLFSDYTKFKNLPRYLVVYLFIYLLITILDLFIFRLILKYSIMYARDVINVFSFTIISTYFINLIISYLFLGIYFLCKRLKFKGEFKVRIVKDYKQSKKELYIINFLIIFVISFFLYIVKIPTNNDNEMNFYQAINNGILSAFALFIAFDTLKDKWNAALNKDEDLVKFILKKIYKDLIIVEYQISNYNLTSCFHCRGKIKFGYSINQLSILFSPKMQNEKIVEIYKRLEYVSNNAMNFTELNKTIKELKVCIQVLI